MRNAVITGQIATIEAQITTLDIYAERTGESVGDIITELTAQQAALTLLLRT